MLEEEVANLASMELPASSKVQHALSSIQMKMVATNQIKFLSVNNSNNNQA